MSANPPSEPERPESPRDETAETQQQWAPPPPPPPPPGGRGRLTRSRDDRMIAGVAGGLGRYAGIDPVIVRIALVVLVLFGGAGALLYLAAVLLVPNEDQVPGAAPAGPRERPSAMTILGVVALVVVACIVIGPIAIVASSIVLPLLFLVLVGLGIAWLVTGTRPQRDPGAIARATFLGLGMLVLLFGLSVAAFWGAGIGGEAVVAAVVIAAGVAVLVAAFVKPARWLVLPALAIALPAGFVAAAGIDLDGGYGERTYRPTSVAAVDRDYEIGIGQVTLDLRDVKFPAGDHRLNVDVGMGEAVVIVPEDLCVTTDAVVGMGQADVFDRGTGGVDVDWVDESTVRPGQPRLVLDADIGVGHLDLRKTDPDYRDWPSRWEDDDPFRGEWDSGRRGSNDACAA